MATAQSRKRRIGIQDRLGQLTYRAACRLMGDEDGAERLRRGAKFEINLADGVYLGGDTLRVNVPDPELAGGEAIVTVVEKANRPKGLQLNCDRCEGRCDHIAAVLGMVLDEKLTLGLSAPPDPSEPIEMLTEEELLRRALADREQRAAAEPMKLRSLDPDQPWTDYTVSSDRSGKTYRVSLRGFEPGESYCSCPDFRTNHLGTCKHIIHALEKLKKRFRNSVLEKPYRRKNLSLRLDYGPKLGLRFNLPTALDNDVSRMLGALKDQATDEVDTLLKVLRKLERAGHPVHVYPDAEEFIEQRLLQQRLVALAAEIRRDPAGHPLRTGLLQAELLPY